MSKDETRPIYGLAFHVDYWNHLGWQDRFSDKRFSQRQYRYLRTWKQQRYYTPQLIVNGRVGMVGSRRQLAREAVRRALLKPPEAAVQLQTRVDPRGEFVSLRYRVEPPDQQLLVNLALVQSKVRSSVTAGENTGRTLEHAGLVRGFLRVLPNRPAGEPLRIKIPADADLEQCRVIAYAQRAKTLEIVGAAQSEPLRHSS